MAMPRPLERSFVACALCPFKVSAMTDTAARESFREHVDWHRAPKDAPIE